jgi:general secretion pathway protein G
VIRTASIVWQHLTERVTWVDATGRRRRSPTRAIGGFTLLELLVVVTIIGLLAAYVGPKYFSQLGKSEQGVTKAQVEALVRALDTYRLDVGQYPTTEEGLNALVIRPSNVAKWNGPYLQKAVPPDPWGRPYLYRAPGIAGDFDIISMKMPRS